MVVRLKCIKVIGDYFSFIKINSLSSHFIKVILAWKKFEFEFKKEVIEEVMRITSFFDYKYSNSNCLKVREKVWVLKRPLRITKGFLHHLRDKEKEVREERNTKKKISKCIMDPGKFSNSLIQIRVLW